MPMPLNQLVHVETTPAGRFVRASIEVTLGEVVSYDTPTTVTADLIRLKGRIAAQQNLTLRCRKLIADPNAEIDTSGTDGARTFPPGVAPPTSPAAGSYGADGADADSGAAAGSVTILAGEIVGAFSVIANGGKGGRGQDGGSGRNGSRGTDGQEAPKVKVKSGSIPTQADRRCNAGSGGDGGGAGNAGKSGNGGNGGAVTIKTLTAAPTISVSNNGGAAGPTPSQGTPGEGGDGGTPGRQVVEVCTYEPALPDSDFDSVDQLATVGLAGEEEFSAEEHARPNLPGHWFCEYHDTLQGQRGLRGNNGPRGTASAARAGADGAKALGSCSIAELGNAIDPLTLDMMCWKAEDDFRALGGVISPDLSERLSFLYSVCAAETGSDTSRKEIVSRIYALKRKSEMGLDYYGYSIEDAPLLSYQTYAGVAGSDLFSQLSAIESAYIAALDKSIAAERRREAIARTITAAETVAAHLRQASLDATSTAQDGALAIEQCEVRVSQAMALLEANREALNAAIKNKAGPNCDLVTVATAAFTIYTTIQTGGASIAAMPGALGNIRKYFELHDKWKDLWENRSVLERDFKTIVGGFTSFQDAVNKIGAEVQALTPEQRKLPSLEMQQQHFDSVATEFIEFPQAAAYRDAGYAYLRACESRNQAIVDFNAALLRLLELQAQAVAAQRAVTSAQSKLTGAYNLDQALVFGLMTRIYRDALSFAGKIVHAERKALGYVLSTPLRVALSEFNASTIADARRQTTQAWLNAKENFRVRRELNADLLTFDLADFCDGKSGATWSAFKSSGRLVLAFRHDHPDYEFDLSHLPCMRVTGLELRLAGVKRKGAPVGTQQVYWRLYQDGHELVFRSDGSVVRFRHSPLWIDGSSSLVGGASLIKADFSERGLYSGLSPFATWALQIKDFELFDFSGLSDAHFRVTGYYLQSGG